MSFLAYNKSPLKELTQIFLCLFLFVSCSDSEVAPEEREFDPEFFEVAEIPDLSASFNIDKESNVIVISSRESNGKVLVYDYSNFEILSEITESGYNETRYADIEEIFGEKYYLTLKDDDIIARELPSLERVFSFDFAQGEILYVESLEVENGDMMLVSTCDYSTDGVESDVLLVDLNNNAVVDSANIAQDGCVRLSTFEKDAQNGIYGIYGVSNGVDPSFIVGEFNSNTNEINLTSQSYSFGEVQYDEIASAKNSDYFITTKRNSVDMRFYSKTDLSPLGTISGWGSNFFVNDQANRIFRFNGSQTVNIYDYPSFRNIETINVPTLGKAIGGSMQGFTDDGFLYIIYFTERKVFMSKLEME